MSRWIIIALYLLGAVQSADMVYHQRIRHDMVMSTPLVVFAVGVWPAATVTALLITAYRAASEP